MTGVAKNTIVKLLVELGAACSDYMDKALVKLKCQRVQCDEIWSFIGAKNKNVTPARAAKGHAGDVWTWVAMDADTKLVCSWTVGRRDWSSAKTLIEDLKGRMANRIQLSTDGLKWYLFAVNQEFEGDIDYGVIKKIYAPNYSEGRYSPPECIACNKKELVGDPDPTFISTSYIERHKGRLAVIADGMGGHEAARWPAASLSSTCATPIWRIRTAIRGKT